MPTPIESDTAEPLESSGLVTDDWALICVLWVIVEETVTLAGVDSTVGAAAVAWLPTKASTVWLTMLITTPPAPLRPSFLTPSLMFLPPWSVGPDTMALSALAPLNSIAGETLAPLATSLNCGAAPPVVSDAPPGPDPAKVGHA